MAQAQAQGRHHCTTLSERVLKGGASGPPRRGVRRHPLILSAVALVVVVIGCSTADSQTGEPETATRETEAVSTTVVASSTTTSTEAPPLGRCERDDGSFASNGSTRGSGDKRERCVSGEWVPYPVKAPPSTTPSEADEVVTNLFLIEELERGSTDSAITEFRAALADFIVILGYERVDVIGGSISDETGLLLVIEATSGYRSEGNQLDSAVDLVSQLASNFWGPDFFGATTASGSGAVGLRFISDGREFVLSGDTMVGVNRLLVSAREALGL